MINYDYYGVFLPQDQKEKLLSVSKNLIPDGWKVYADHCTTLHHLSPVADYIPERVFDMFLGKKITFNVIGYGKSDAAVAAMVDLPSLNQVSHITLAVAPGHRPVESNEIREWSFISGFQLYGHFDVRTRHE